MTDTFPRRERLRPPYGGRLVGLLPEDDERADLIVYAKALPSIQLAPRSLSDIELLAIGALSPLDRFMGRDDHVRVVEEMRLTDGTLFPIPVTLSVTPGEEIAEGKDIAGLTAPGDIDHYARVRACKILVDKYHDPARTVFGLLPLVPRMAGPREAVWHAIIRRNYGASHVAVALDHASSGVDSSGRAF